MNYNIKVIKPGTTQAKFLEEIEPGSTVLECGCATGYMTRFLKEEVGAKVYIVEYEKRAFDIAINYAEGGLCADLMGDEWREYFRGYTFDYIMFADVLEHVYDPKYVLQSATALLKKDGKMLVSLPNIGHNDILMTLYEDNWTYKPIGLLDETHIRFFGRNNLDKFFNDAGLSIIKKDYVAKDYEDTEQRIKYNNDNAILLDALKLREYGNIYQFVIIAQRTDYVVQNSIETEVVPAKPAGYVANAFYSDTIAFSKDRTIKLSLDVNGVIDEQIDYTKINANYFRYDPIEGTHCVIKDILFEADGEQLNIISHNAKKINNSLFIFENNDPQMVVKVPEGTKVLTIKGKAIPIFTNLERELTKRIIELENDNQKLLEDNKEMKENFEKTKESMNQELESIKNSSNSLQANYEALQEKYDELIKKYEHLSMLYADMENEFVDVCRENNKNIRRLRGSNNNLKNQNNKLKRTEGELKKLKETSSYKLTESMKKFQDKFDSEKKKKEKDKEQKLKEQVSVINNSPLFDAEWYLERYPDLKDLKMSLAEHYYTLGWKENRNPSKNFSTEEYFILNNGVQEKGMCPLLHYEKYGKYEQRSYRIKKELEVEEFKPSEEEILEFERLRDEEETIERAEYENVEIVPNKIVFKTFQSKYTCNPKYICEELLGQDLDYDIVWLYKPEQRDKSEFPSGVRLVPLGSKKAREELASAKIIIDNGSMPFDRRIDKKADQVGICTWHGSLGFKKIGIDTVKNRNGYSTVERYRKNHDILISNSEFEDEVYRTSYWPDSKIVKLGHARNDMLVNHDPREVARYKRKVYIELGIEPGTNMILYAPTFRENMVHHTTSSYIPKDVLEKGSYDINYDAVVKAFTKRFGGKWVVLARHHFVNSSNEGLKEMIPDNVVNATKYPDIQELMMAADAAITDYSSWILDFMFTKKPGFVFAVDADAYETNRGMYYPLRTAPFPVATNSKELIENIEGFDNDKYINRVEEFLVEKGCIEDGNASKKAAEMIKEIIENK